MRAVIYFLAGVVLVAAAAVAIAYGSDNLSPPAGSGAAQEAPEPTNGPYRSYGQLGDPEEADDCDEATNSYGRPIDSCASP